MDFRKPYQSMNECIAPDEALVSDTLARMRQGQRPRRAPRRLRRIVAIAAAAAVAVGCVTPALAANVPAVYEVLYALLPAAAQALMPVNEVCEDQGVRMEVVSAFVEGDTAGVYLTLTDTTGALFGDSAPDLYDSYSLHYPARVGQVSNCTLIQYAPDTSTATYYLEITNMDGERYKGDKFTFSVRTLLTGRLHQDDIAVDADLSAVPLDPPTETHPITGASWSPSVQNDSVLSQSTYDFLVPQQPLWQSEDGIFSLAAAGYHDGRLRLLYTAQEAVSHDNHAWYPLYIADGTILEPVYSVYYNDKETDTGYAEFVYDIDYADVAGCTLSGNLSTSGPLISGNWQVTFRLGEE